MKQFCYTLLALVAICVAPTALAMIKNDVTENNASVVKAHLKNKKIPSLKTLATKKIVNYFDPDRHTLTIEQCKAFRNHIIKLPADIQNHVLKTILKEKPKLLEQILESIQQPVELTGWDAHDCFMSPDSKFLFMCARRKQSAHEPDYLIKVNMQTLAQEEIINITNKGIAFNAEGKEITLSEFKDNSTCVSLYNLGTKQSKLLLEANNVPVPPNQYFPYPKVFFSANNNYATIIHQRKSYCINLATAQLCCPILDGEAIPLDNARIILCDWPHHAVNIITIPDGKTALSAQHQTATHCSCLPSYDLAKQHLYTVCDTTLNIYSLADNSLLGQIVFERPLSGIDTSGKKLRLALMHEEYAHDVVEVDLDSGAYKIRARKQYMPSSMSACHANLSTDSLFHVHDRAFRGRLTLQNKDGNLILQHPTSLYAHTMYPHLSPDNSFIYSATALDGNRGTERMTYIKILTHRALTNNTPLKDILALLILERQKQCEDLRDGQLWGDLLLSPNPLMRSLADTRYINSWKESVLNFIKYFDVL